jgi:CHAT domain-containing protein/tetratricopeptide (TPR) repeat protein
VIAPLLILLTLSGSAAAPSGAEKAYRKARAMADRGDLLDAQTAVEATLRSRPCATATATDEWTAALCIMRGELLIKRRTPAEVAIGVAIVTPPLPPRLQTTEAAVRRLLALGFANSNAAYFEEALRLAEAHQPRLMTDVHLAMINIAPDLVSAEKHARIVATLAQRTGNELSPAIANNALSRQYSAAQRYPEAIDRGEKAIRGFRKLGVQGRLSAACGNLGWPYLELGDYDRATELFTCAIEAARKAGYADHEVAWTNQLGNLQFAQRHFGDAEREYMRALAAGRKIASQDLPSILTNLARVAVETRRFADARRFNDEALRLKRANQPPDNDPVQRSRILDARIAMYEGRADPAEKTLQSVIAASTRKDTRWEAQARLAQLYARLQRNAEADASFRKAMATIRGARADLDSELKLSFSNVATDVFGSYVDYLVGRGRIDEALAVTENVRAQTLEELLGVAAQKKENVTPRAVSQATGATILSYWLGDDRSYVWTITPASVTLQPLPPKLVIERAAGKYRHTLVDPPGASLGKSGAEGAALYRMLVAPALPRAARNARVIIVPHGGLYAINFETLTVGSPLHYWIEDVILSTAASVQLLAHRAPPMNAAPSMLIVGNPPRVDPAYPPLTHAQEEVDKVAGRFARTTKLTGPQATPAAYRAVSPGKFDYVHFVAHGVATLTSPLDSAVILGRSDATQEYHLFARDIVDDRNRLNARLVTISSCHGAGTRIYAGEGLVGLAWAFLGAGADNVIAALWDVDDSATPALMDRMYASIRAGRDPAVALRDAKLALVHGQGAYRRPVYWAPFVLYSGS